MPSAIRLRRISTHSCCVQMPEEAEWLRAALATVFVQVSGLLLWFCGCDGGGLLFPSPKQWLQ